MTQLDPRSPTTRPSTPDGQPRAKKEAPFNWRVSVGMAIGLVVLFGVLFGLRGLGIFPPRPGEDPEIAAARATLAALPTQQPAPAAQPTPAPTQPPAQAAPGLATPVVTSSAAATAAPSPTTAPATPLAQLASTAVPQSATTGTVFETAPTPVATSTSDQAPAVAATSTSSNSSSTEQATLDDASSSASAQPTPVAVNLPADLANAILQGYTNYWIVRVDAMRDPTDSSIDLASVMAGSELIGAQQTIAQYRDAGEAFDSDVKHTIWITSASQDNAVLVDQFTATTLRVDPDTKAPIDATASIENRTDTFELQRMDGAWKVVDEP